MRLIVPLILSISLSGAVNANENTLRYMGKSGSKSVVIPAMTIKGDKRVGEEYGEASVLISVGDPYDCADFTPRAEDVDSGQSFTQTGTCQVDERRKQEVFYLYESGKRLSAGVEERTVVSVSILEREATGLKELVSRDYVGTTSRKTTFCVGFTDSSTGEKYWITSRTHWHVYESTYSNGDTETENEYYKKDTYRFDTPDREVCVEGSQSL
tara:strand:- start:941 stop:1576 length:636 start_codon:yes stop_codon:yes gene_type:complete